MNLVDLALGCLAGLLALLALALLLTSYAEPAPPDPVEQQPLPARRVLGTGLGGAWPPVTFCDGRCCPTPAPPPYTTGILRIPDAPR
ncbi:hypothetical protein SAMN04487983_106222 [Streptomyces sp. yr375]|uniref:hypothetical protein n=1 Tax=Streptomyces sp. yr375 TaxID=1761906 RepID=UPI0008D4B0EF|nr:hypothetical protein [Streptomyces sp. yr375]SES47008.1 hypothetical protein SAMN04487983_106222 [Streptomyces sp. yr375]